MSIGLYVSDIGIDSTVATATVERALSAMNILKNQRQNWIGNQWMNDS